MSAQDEVNESVIRIAIEALSHFKPPAYNADLEVSVGRAMVELDNALLMIRAAKKIKW